MKRSEINQIMKDAKVFIEERNFKLSPFAYWTYGEWKTKSKEYLGKVKMDMSVN